MYEIKDSEIKSFDNKTSNGVYTQDGNLQIYVLTRTLEKYKADVKRGDYIAYRLI